jgi:DNA-binding response OmpR family regulator
LLLASVAATLREHGYWVLEAPSGAAALQLLDADREDVAIASETVPPREGCMADERTSL